MGIGLKRILMTSCATLLVHLISPLSAVAQDYPIRPIKIVVPFAPGGSTDIVARMLGQRLATSMRQPVIVENKPGATGILGVDAVAKAQPDGYTLLVTTSSSLMSSRFMYEKLPFIVERDLSLVYQVAQVPAVLVVNSDLRVNSASELLKYVSTNKGKLAYGSWGLGTPAHLAGAYMDFKQHGEMAHAVYKGESLVMQELLAGRVHMAFITASIAAPHIAAGNVRGLAVTSARRTPSLPQVPTMQEQGVLDPAYRLTGWIGLAVPASTPSAIVKRLNDETRKAVQEEGFRSRVTELGMDPLADSSPEAFKSAFQHDLPIWGELIKQAGIKPQ